MISVDHSWRCVACLSARHMLIYWFDKAHVTTVRSNVSASPPYWQIIKWQLFLIGALVGTPACFRVFAYFESFLSPQRTRIS